MAGCAGEEVVVAKHLVKRRKANSLEPMILELDSKGEDDMEPEGEDQALLQQVDTSSAELQWGDEDYDDWEAVLADQSRRVEKLALDQRKLAAEQRMKEILAKREREILAKLPLIPFQEKYSYQYQCQEAEEEETECTKEQMALEERQFAVYRSSRESSSYGSFEHITTLSPMYFTHWPPERIPFGIGTPVISLQIYSFEIQMKGENLKWPLYVYGVVAARDNVDHDRNLLFYRTRDNPQILTQDDQFLGLTGPSRAIFALDPVDFEVQLKLKGRTESRDRPLMNQRYSYFGGYTTGSTSIKFENCKCAAELSLEKYPKTVQATILGVRIVEGSLFPFKYGGRVVCYSPPEEHLPMGSDGTVDVVMDLSKEITLLDSRDFGGSEMPMSRDGYLDLSRRVVSVQLQEAMNCSAQWESLKVVIEAYSESLANNKERKRRLGSKDIDAKGHVMFRPKYCNIGQGMCDLGNSKVEVTVAWSAIVTSKKLLSLMG